MRISDSVANYILQMLNEENGIAEIQRNELANALGCVPSQINYVITSRFTPEQGYIVESRRGGGGYIRIIRRSMTKSDMIMHLVNSVGQSLDAASMRAILRNLVETGVTTESDARLMAAALADSSLAPAPKECRDALRASLFKNMLLVLDT
ncbi:MAG: CtsR family transcriptional regulator [Hominenteromicrobium sp.]